MVDSRCSPNERVVIRRVGAPIVRGQTSDPRSVRKTVRLESGEVLEAEFHIRYYPPGALAALAYVAGLRLARLHEPLTETTPQLIALLEK